MARGKNKTPIAFSLCLSCISLQVYLFVFLSTKVNVASSVCLNKRIILLHQPFFNRYVGTEPVFVTVYLSRRPGSIPSLAGRYDNPICRTGPPCHIGRWNGILGIDSWSFTNTGSGTKSQRQQRRLSYLAVICFHRHRVHTVKAGQSYFVC
jgi:hypothetical protein